MFRKTPKWSSSSSALLNSSRLSSLSSHYCSNSDHSAAASGCGGSSGDGGGNSGSTTSTVLSSSYGDGRSQASHFSCFSSWSRCPHLFKVKKMMNSEEWPPPLCSFRLCVCIQESPKQCSLKKMMNNDTCGLLSVSRQIATENAFSFFYSLTKQHLFIGTQIFKSKK